MKIFFLSLVLTTFFSCKKNDDTTIEPPLLSANEFLINAGGIATDLVNDMFISSNENIYLTGLTRYYQTGDSLRFGNKIVKSFGGEDALIVKYDRYGNAIWAKVIGSSGSDEGAVITGDSQDNCYVAGVFGGQTNFGNTSLTPDNSSGAPGQLDMFLAKYDAQGKEIWVRHISGVGVESPTSLLIDKTGNLFVVGCFYQNAKFGTTTLTSPGASIFLAKYTSDGSLLWAKSYGTNAFVSINPTNLKLDNNDNIIITGSFQGQQTIGSFSILSNGNQDVFTAKLDANGTVQWVKTFGGNDYESCFALTIDQANNIYIGGDFKGSISTAGFIINSTGNKADAFFAKLAPDGSIVWVKSASGDGEESVRDMVIQKDTLYSAGFFSENLKVENRLAANIGWSAFVTKHDLTGGLAGLTEMKLNNGIAKKIYVNSSDFSILSGYFSNSISFENMGTTAFGGFDFFILKSKLPFK